MANNNFVVHNGLTVGSTTIFAGNGDIITGGNITSTSTNVTTSVGVQKQLMQLPFNLVSPGWYLLGTFAPESGTGAGETMEITITGGKGYVIGDSLSKDIIQIRLLNGTGTPNITSNFYNYGTVLGVSNVKLVESNGGTTGTGASWDVYVYVNENVGNGFVEVKTSHDSTFTWNQVSASDPGTGANIVVATNKFETATSNVVVTTGNLWVGGNIFQMGQQVATSTGNGWLTVTITGNGTTGPYNLSNVPSNADQMAVWWNGVYQPKSTWILSTNTIQFTQVIPSGSIVEIKILAGAGAQTLSTLQDINFSTLPTDGQFLSYNSASGKWVPATSTAQSQVTKTAITWAVALGGSV